MHFSGPAPRLAAALVFCGGLAFAAHGISAHAGADTDLAEPFDPSAMDTTANACEDFFAYATGTWRNAEFAVGQPVK